jgi:tetratricopeptide (TPR) repeat protein
MPGGDTVATLLHCTRQWRTSILWKLALVILSGLAAGCAPKRAVLHEPAAVPEYEVLFAAGQAAFREATPEGYERAADAFRKASSLRPERCEYSLHLAEALLFFALEQKLNQEDTTPAAREAGKTIDSVESQPCASGFASILNRVKALSLSPGVAEGQVGNATIQIQARTAGHDDIDSIDRAIAADPNDPMNWLVLWKLSPVDPRAPLLRANTLAPDLPVVQYEMGSANLILSHYPEARRNFERAIERSPRHFHSMIGLADAIGGANPDSTEPLPLYQKASAVAPRYLEAHALLGDYYDQIEEIDKALDQYSTIVSLNSKYEPGQLSLGITLFKAGRSDDAEKTLRAALSLNSGDAQAHYYLANIGLRRGDLTGAQAEAELAIRYGRAFVEGYYLLGLILERESRIDEALRQYEQALRIRKDYPDALLARGDIRMQRGQWADALADFTAAVQAYRSQSAAFEKEAVKAEAAGFLLKARAQRARKAEAEDSMRRAEVVQQRVQTAMKP